MGSKIKTVTSGGGSATPVANDFNNFLRQGLNNGSYGTVGQTQGVGSTINSLLNNNNGGGMGNFNDLMSRFSQTPNYQAPQIGGFNPTSTSFGGMDFSQGMGGQAPQMSGVSPFSLPNSVSTNLPGGGADLGNIVSQIGMRNLLPGVNQQTPEANTNVNTSGQQNTPEFDAISKILGNQFTKDLGDIRERYGVSSAGLNAESVYRGQAIPQLSQALSQSALSQRQAGQTDVGLGLQGSGLNLQGALGRLGAGVNQRGQDLESLLTGRSQDISTGGLASQNSLANIQNLLQQQGQGINQRGMDINALLSGRGQDLNTQQNNLQSMLQNRGMDINQMGNLSQMLLGQGGLNLQGQQSNASNFLGGQGLLNQYMQNYGGLGLGQGQLGQQGQLAALQQLFGSFQQANQLGTPQAQTQTYQQPSGFSQAMSGIAGLAGGIGGLMTGMSGMGMLGGLFGGNGAAQSPTVPMGNFGNMSIPGVTQMNPGAMSVPMQPITSSWNGSGGGGY